MQYKNGQITVFLSLILIVILSLICGIVETVRLNVLNAHINRVLVAGLDSVMADYYLPLYEEYDLFLLDGTYGGSKLDEVTIKEKLRGYLEFGLDVKESTTKGFSMLEVNLEEIELTDVTPITEYPHEIFTKEVGEYMKFRVPLKAFEKFLDTFSLLNKTKVTVDIMDEKLVIEEEIEELNKELINLIQLIEGISYDSKGVNYTSNKLLKTHDYFVKKITSQPISMQVLLINNEKVFLSLKDKYIDINKTIDKIDEQLDKIKYNLNQISNINNGISDINTQIAELTIKLNNLNEEKEKESKNQVTESEEQGKESKKQNKESKEKDKELKEIQKIIIEKNSQIAKQKKQIESLYKECESGKKIIDKETKSIKTLINKMIEKITKSIEIIGNINTKKDILIDKLEGFSDKLDENKDQMLQSIYENFNEEVTVQKENLSKKGLESIEDIEKMKQTLSSNLHILNQATLIQSTISNDIKLNEANLNSYKESINQWRTLIAGYSIAGLKFDYSGLFNETKVNDPRDSIQAVLNKGVLSLLVEDESSLSKNKISTGDLLSVQSEINQNDVMNFDNIKSTKGIFNLFGNYNSIKEIGIDIINTLMVNEYIIEHFKGFVMPNKTDNEDNSQLSEGVNQSNKKFTKDTVLAYEKEYILEGRDNDYENLTAILKKIIGIRFIFNMMHILGDKQKTEKAEVTAQLLSSFAGAFKVVACVIIKLLILSAWSYAESIVDCKTLIEDKGVTLLKASTEWKTSYEDLFLFNKTFVANAAESMEDSKGGFYYDDYIRFLLLLSDSNVKNLRTLDLIQSNIRLNENVNFSLHQALYGIRVKITGQTNHFFNGFPFTNKEFYYLKNGYRFIIEKEYSY